MELREVTNIVVPARSASLDKGPYTPGGRHFTSPGAEEATLRGAARMLLNLLTTHKEAVSRAEARCVLACRRGHPCVWTDLCSSQTL